MYYPALYSLNSMAEPEMSTCTGPPVGKPMSVPLSGCAEACNREITPPYRCTAFQYFQIQDGDEQKPLCFLLREIDTIRSYRCEGLPSLAQTNSALRGDKSASVISSNRVNQTAKMDLCDRVKHAKRFSGMSCQAIFGAESKVIKI